MEQNQNFKCSGNCLNCLPAQRAYCASQHAYSNMKVLDNLMGIVLTMQGSLEELGKKIEAIQNNEAAVFDPTRGTSEIPTDHDTAQEGVGASVEPQESIT